MSYTDQLAGLIYSTEVRKMINTKIKSARAA